MRKIGTVLCKIRALIGKSCRVKNGGERVLKIAICDDEKIQRERIAALLEAYFRERPQLHADLRQFADGQALLSAAQQGKDFDLYVLDVLMPRLNGIEVGKALRSMGREGIILYLTASPDYAVDSYLTQAFFYLLKPVAQQQLFEVLDRAMASLHRQKSAATIVNTASGLRSIPLDDILYIERVDRLMRYYLTHGESVDSRAIRCSFREAAAALLADSRFILCGASFVLNLHHVKAVEHTSAVLDNGVRVPLSRAAYGEVKMAWMNYWLGGKDL